jgi:hypothetical protein
MSMTIGYDFAVGRTTFWNALVDYRARKITRDAAVS